MINSPVERLLSPSLNSSFFLFGARGTGKTTFLREQFFSQKTADLNINLLTPAEFDLFLKNPQELLLRLEQIKKVQSGWVFIDEIQKLPVLLDLIQDQIVSGKFRFALTGSSARKLKKGAANLLAGRAFVYNLYPFSSIELGNQFSLHDFLEWGSLPKIYDYNQSDRKEYLQAYTQVYLKEEILEEQLVRKIAPFRQFLDVAAQSSGQILSYSNIARDCGSDPVSTRKYFEILVDTLIGFELLPFHESIRKRQRKNPKFYFFDIGVKRALDGTLGTSVIPSTSQYGVLFEHFIIQEIMRLSSYSRKNWKFSYLRTKDDAEVDLIIERPGLPRAVIEIKSTSQLNENHLSSFLKISKDFRKAECFCFTNDPHPKKIGNVECLPWSEGLKALGIDQFGK